MIISIKEHDIIRMYNHVLLFYLYLTSDEHYIIIELTGQYKYKECFMMSRSKILNQADKSRKPVTIVDKGGYYDVTLNFNTDLSHKEIGKKYGEEILKVVPDFEQLVDSYLQHNFKDKQDFYNIVINQRIPDIKSQINQDYLDEIEGMASVFNGGDQDVLGDGKISLNEAYLCNLIPDVIRATQCSAVSVFGTKSKNGKNIIGRNVDWGGGANNEISKFQAVIRIKSEHNDICLIGYLGYMGVITGFNEKNLFAAILDSTTGEPYTSEGKYSYPLDIREALEKKDTLDEVANFLMDSERPYAYSHNIVLADKEVTKILENNISIPKRELRSFDSDLNEGIEWGMSDAIAVVNSFLLEGTIDNHNPKDHNTARWRSIINELSSKGDKVSFEEIKEVMSYNDGISRKKEDGAIYNSGTQQIIVVEPETSKLEVFFFPKDQKELPQDPVFVEVNI